MPFLDQSSDFFWVPPGYTTPISIDSVRVDVTRNAAGWKSIESTWESLRVVPLNRTTAVYTGILRWLPTDTTGRKTLTRMIESGVVVKRADGWRLLAGQTAILAPDG
jgi:hypothetical protein